LFDLDGTLRHNQPNGYETLIEFLAELGHAPSAEQVRAGHRWTHYYWSISPEMKADLAELGAETAAFWVRQVERQLGVLGLGEDAPPLAVTLAGLFEERYRPEHHVPADAAPTLRRLRRLGYTLGLVSNRTEPLDPLAEELGLAEHLDFTLSAGQAGSWKPDAGIFWRALEMAASQPEATVYVGDNYYADVEGASGAGLQPVLFDPLGLFPEAVCPVITTLGGLGEVLDGGKIEPPSTQRTRRRRGRG